MCKDCHKPIVPRPYILCPTCRCGKDIRFCKDKYHDIKYCECGEGEGEAS